MKKLFLAIVAVVATCTLSAQELRWGVTGAVNFANVNMAGLNSSDCFVGFNLGARAELSLEKYISEGFYADARAIYTLKGGQWKDNRKNLGYVEVPLNFGYKYLLTPDVQLFGGLGPYLAFGVVGKDVVKTGDAKLKTDIFGVSYKRFDCGLNYNVGVELYDKWQIFLGFEHSVLNAAKIDLEGTKFKARPQNFYVGCALMF